MVLLQTLIRYALVGGGAAAIHLLLLLLLPRAGQQQEQQQMNRRSTAAHQGVANQCLQQDQASVQSALVTVP